MEQEIYFNTHDIEEDVCFSYEVDKRGVGDQMLVEFKTKVYDYRDFTIFYFEANGYLRSQIRMMVGFLLKISEGKLNANQLKNQLDKKEITSTTLAPANGLYLAKIKY